ncbi:MAG: HAD family phosphatase [Armatimonadetes bacterium]|nr:HAD family phosphatase [Armatimonadota bacterium]MBI2247747.1 HAD family phosphatase [Armatimonadota bacterium]
MNEARSPKPDARQFKLLVADIDGTLVTSDRKITPRVKQAVREAQARGVRICLATGRIWPSAQQYFRALGADPPAILLNGGMIYDFAADTILRRVPLAYEHARAVLEIIRAVPQVQPHLYVADKVYTGRTNEYTVRYSRKDSLHVEEVGDLVAFLPQDPMKILIIGPRAHLATVYEKVAALPQGINAVFSEETYLEILPKGSSKGAALAEMTKALGIPLEAVIAVGDNLNDLEMIRLAGLGVAMGNAPEELRRHAKYVTRTNDDEGLAEVIHRFILEEPKRRVQ